MISKKSILAVIVGRGGSKGLPGKNIAKLKGRPLIAWSVAAAKASRYVDRVILSSDDPAIVAAAKKAGCEIPFIRPAQLATDTASVYDVVIHALKTIDEKYDYVVLLQATSPLRNAADIDKCIALCHKHETPVVSVCMTPKPPQWLFYIGKEGQLRPVLSTEPKLTRRQDVQSAYIPNGAVYVAKTDWLCRHKKFYSKKTRAYVMPTERSIDIDTMSDLLLARILVDQSKNTK